MLDRIHLNVRVRLRHCAERSHHTYTGQMDKVELRRCLKSLYVRAEHQKWWATALLIYQLLVLNSRVAAPNPPYD
ncbi:MAG: hypothetical protein AB4426_23640 [Xenococcaceae cyanobacterium]